jgi:hypothetical protein
MAKRYGHFRPEVQRIVLSGIATDEIHLPVHQIDNQEADAVESSLLN